MKVNRADTTGTLSFSNEKGDEAIKSRNREWGKRHGRKKSTRHESVAWTHGEGLQTLHVQWHWIADHHIQTIRWTWSQTSETQQHALKADDYQRYRGCQKTFTPWRNFCTTSIRSQRIQRRQKIKINFVKSCRIQSFRRFSIWMWNFESVFCGTTRALIPSSTRSDIWLCARDTQKRV